MAYQNLLEKFEALQKENEELRKKLQDREPFIHKNPYECLSQQDDHMEQDNEELSPNKRARKDSIETGKTQDFFNPPTKQKIPIVQKNTKLTNSEPVPNKVPKGTTPRQSPTPSPTGSTQPNKKDLKEKIPPINIKGASTETTINIMKNKIKVNDFNIKKHSEKNHTLYVKSIETYKKNYVRTKNGQDTILHVYA